MKIKSKTMLGVSLLVMTFSLNVAAQTCKTMPTCAELGYTATSCPGDSLKCPFDTTKLYCVSQGGADCDIGSFYYADNTCRRIPKTTEKAIGVVFDPINRLAISYRNSDIDKSTTGGGNWSDNATNIDIPNLPNYTTAAAALTDTNGKSNTQTIVAFGKTKNYTYKPAQYCNNMTLGGKKWYLPSVAEAVAFARLCPIIEAISVLGDPPAGDILYACFSDQNLLATSTEYDASNVWGVQLKRNTNTYKWFDYTLEKKSKAIKLRVKCIFKY